MTMPAAIKIFLSLDVGDVRIGVASANTMSRIASPLMTVKNDEDVKDTLLKLIEEQEIAGLVVGLPRGLSGQDTPQTQKVRDFVESLSASLTVPVYWQDEATTSLMAEAELKKRGKAYQKEDIDALAATYILEDFLREHPEGK
jgi:putative Holliday junction resolvase